MLRYISIIVTRRMGTEECKCCKENSDLLAETVIVAIKCITYRRVTGGVHWVRSHRPE